MISIWPTLSSTGRSVATCVFWGISGIRLAQLEAIAYITAKSSSSFPNPCFSLCSFQLIVYGVFCLRKWRNWQTHHLEGVAPTRHAGSSPAFRTGSLASCPKHAFGGQVRPPLNPALAGSS